MGLFLLADVRRIRVPWEGWAAAVITGVGFFQLFDGVVNHKILCIQQIRYGVDLFVYDLVWIGSAIVLLVAGTAALWARHGRRAAYLAAVWTVERDRPWPAWRSALWLSGLVCVVAGLIGPLAAAAHASFTAHMAGNLLIGMLGPLLLVLAAPVSLALRALPTVGARAVITVLRSPPS